MIFESGKKFIMKEYLCACDCCRQFEFGKCESEEKSETEIQGSINDGFLDDDEFESSQYEQIFDFIDTPSFFTLFTGASSEPLYFLKLTKKVFLMILSLTVRAM